AFAQLRALARAGTPASVAVYGGNNQTGAVGSRLADSLAVIVRDTYGNPVQGVGVSWSSPNGGSILPNPAPTDAQGVARVGWTLPTTPGPLSAVAGVGNASAAFTATAVAGPPASVTVTPTAITASPDSTVTVTATVRDAYGNVVPSAPLTWSSSNPAVASVAAGQGQAAVTTRDAGTATVTASAGAGATGTVQVTVAALRFTDVLAGASCGISTAGVLYCWGERSSGTGAPPTIVPRPYVALNDRVYTQLADRGVCMLDQQGNVKCQLGTTTTGPFAFISGSSSTVCMLDAAGAAYCWGFGNLGQVGQGSRQNAPNPTAVAGGRTYTTIASGNTHSCARTPAGEVYCWGLNTSGQLGLGTTTGPDGCGLTSSIPCSQTPRLVLGGLTFRSIGMGGTHSCGVATDGSVWCWGSNGSGQLGDGTTTSSSVPVRVTGVSNLKAITGSDSHTCGIAQDDSVWCWGENGDGQLGTGNTTDSLVPVQVSGGLRASVISALGANTCAISTAGSTWCWGNNETGAVGDGTSGNDRPVPTRVTGT
ncbi:MAG TPA: Ig-like domain-containing protein, partial [Longimicrobium sp.]|nr:Ig-like domain-containing protein [Longimicrobium sp.]